MTKHILVKAMALSLTVLAFASCKVPAITATDTPKPVAVTYGGNTDTVSSASVSWRDFFTDPHLVILIDTALKNNQELLITMQENEIARNDIQARKGAILPSVSLGGGAGVEKVGRYTSQGAGDATTEIKPGKEMPDPLMDFKAGITAHWEADIWNKLHNAKKEAVLQYLATVEGKNFVLSNLVAEIADSYYELVSLDNQLRVINQNISLQEAGLEIVKVQKEAARATELAVQKFQAEVLKSKSLQFGILQQIKETENRINFLLARYPQPILRYEPDFLQAMPASIKTGISSQLLMKRPDIRQAELELEAAKLDVKIARAEFFPSLGITANFGLQAFNPAYLVKLPESLLYSLAGDLAGPIINRNAITAEFKNANARQLQALYNYDRTVLNAFLEVSTQLSNIENLEKNYSFKDQQVKALSHSIEISNDLFRSARADYLEVLTTQRDVLEAKLELIETKKQQMNAVVNIYRDLGGGWR